VHFGKAGEAMARLRESGYVLVTVFQIDRHAVADRRSCLRSAIQGLTWRPGLGTFCLGYPVFHAELKFLR
jgi:hypothetical protein